ncbi:MAG: hypothetical protein WBA76_00325 [Phormidesmis sp.]
MVRTKKTSPIIAIAQSRLSGMKSVSDKLDLGSGCSTATVEAKIKEALAKLENYNKLKFQTAAAMTEFEQTEKELARLSKQILLGAAMKFDNDSKEYEMVGGVRMSDRRRPQSQLKPPATPAPVLS